MQHVPVVFSLHFAGMGYGTDMHNLSLSIYGNYANYRITVCSQDTNWLFQLDMCRYPKPV